MHQIGKELSISKFSFLLSYTVQTHGSSRFNDFKDSPSCRNNGHQKEFPYEFHRQISE